ncbi:hypothetical protein [Micromonospora haikouensis]|uniref:hypothetical protein n=1 Tax=Micromonospora haikouensis TaxID=686309 RepID=UPI0011876AE0|nr:hypothetical protein [Micromonospora haikouensis]
MIDPKRFLAATGTAAALVLFSSTPAMALSSTGFKDSFFNQCDANVTIDDALVGSPGKIEAWGGYVCPTGSTWAGTMTITIKRNGVAVKKTDKAANGKESSDSVNAAVADDAGTQDWQATLTLFRPGFSQTLIATGVIPS